MTQFSLLVASGIVEVDMAKQSDQLNKIEKLAIKMVNATEYYDNLIQCDWVKLPPEAKKLARQYGQQILDILRECK